MKTKHALPLWLWLALALPAQAQPAASPPATNREEVVRRLLDQEYRRLISAAPLPPASKSGPARSTNGSAINGSVSATAVTNVAATPASDTNRPAIPATAPAAAQTQPAAPTASAGSPTAAPAVAPPGAAVTTAGQAQPVPVEGAVVPPSSTAPASTPGAPATPTAPATVAPGLTTGPGRTSLTISNVAAALRARGLTNQAAALTNRASFDSVPNAPAATTETRPAPSTAAAPSGFSQRPSLVAPLPGAGPAANVIVPAASGARPGAPNLAGQVAPAGPGAAAPGAAVVAARGAVTNAPEEDIIPPGEIKFQEADLLQVLDIYQQLTGRTILRPTSLPATKISIKTQNALTRKEAVQALDSILSLNGITMVPQGEKFVKAVAETQAFTQANQTYEGPASGLPESGTFVTYVAQLKNAVPTEIQPALTPFSKLPGGSILAINSSGILILRDYAENVKRMVELIEKIDVVPPREIETVVIPIRYALAGEIANVLGSLTAGGGGGVTTVGQQQTRTGLTGPGGGFGTPGFGAGGTAGYPGQPGYNPANPQTGVGSRSGFGSQAAQRSSFSDRLRNIVQRAAATASGEIVVLGQTKIIADERTNSLLIFATKDDIETIKDIISKLDVVLAQVLIEALIFEIALDDNISYGISYLQRQPSTIGNFTGIGAIKNGNFLAPNNFLTLGTNAAGGLASGFSYFARWGDFDIAADAIATDNRVRILQRPRVQTSHALEANLFVGETRPYPTGSSYGGLYGAYNTIQQLQIGITLSVVPLINADGLVVMDIRQKIQQVGGEVEIANVGKVPSTIDREVNTKVAVRDRDTIVLGGFISNEARKSASGVPIIKDIPLLGNLFRTTSRNKNRKELMILIRPTVLPTPEVAALVAAEERAKMPSVSSMERNMMETDRKNREKVNNELLKREGLPE